MQPALTGWRAALTMRLVPRGARTVIDELRHEGPLRVQRAFYPEVSGVAHVYLLHPPGGLVGGDQLSVEVDVAEGAHALLTTPAAGKLYRSEQRHAEQRQLFRVAGTLEWLPQENIHYAGAWSRLTTRVELEPQATFLGWETTALGRPAAQEKFARGEAQQRFEIHRGGRPIWLERGVYAGGSDLLDHDAGLGGFSSVATFVAAGPRLGTIRTRLDGLRQAMDAVPGTRHAITCLDDVLIVRALGHSAEAVRRPLAAVWSAIREPLTGAPPVPPRIWST